MDSTKDRQAAKARNLLALLGRERGAWSLKTLANRVNRDYSTLSRGAGKVAKKLQSDPQLAKTWKALWDK